MSAVRREDILDYVAYEQQRETIRTRIFEEKRRRRVHVGGVLTFLFENTETIRYQIHEMIRAERLAKEEEIRHEIETYGALLGGPGELACALLIELEDPEQRAEKLVRWRDLPGHVYVRLEDGTRVYARFDPGQIGEDRLSSVQYLKFDTGGRVPVAVGTDHAEMRAETVFSDEQRASLAADLAA